MSHEPTLADEYKAERDEFENEVIGLKTLNAELVEALADVMRDQLKTVNLHQMALGPRQRIEKARAVLSKVSK